MIDYRWLRPVLAGAVLMVGVAALFAAPAGLALADANELSISPAAVEVAPGGSTTVQLIADPPAETLALWTIDVLFDPDVVTTSSRNCDTLDAPANSTTIGLCVVNGGDDDGVSETVIVLGGLVFNDDGDGLSERTVLADITFEAVGGPGECTDLHLRVLFHTDSGGEETNPLLFDGRICVEQDAPPSGTAVPHTPAPRTSEPTPTPSGSVGLTLPPLESETPTTGDETPGGSTQGAGPAPGAGPDAAPGGGGEDGGGDGALIWALLVVGVLIAAAGVAWAVVRRRGAGSGPEGGPSAG